MTHYLKLNPIPFFQIESGNKTIELRLYDEKRQKIVVGDILVFTHQSDENKKITAIVTALHRFENFEKLYACLPLTKCGYSKENAKSASSSDMAQYYTPEEENRFGVVGIEFILQK